MLSLALVSGVYRNLILKLSNLFYQEKHKGYTVISLISQVFL